MVLHKAVGVDQIPSRNLDLPVLSSVKWGMQIDEARAILNGSHHLRSGTDTTLVYRENVHDGQAWITLQFPKPRGKLSLVKISFEKPSRDLLATTLHHLKARYGQQFNLQRKEEKKFFMTVVMEVWDWRVEEGQVLLTGFFNGENPLALMIVYAPPRNRSETGLKKQEKR